MSTWSVVRLSITVLPALLVGWAAPARVPAADAATGASTPGVRRLTGKTAAPQPLAVDAAGRLVAVATPCECIVYDLESGEERRRWNDGTRVAAFTRDGRFLVATGPGRVTLWDTDDFVERARITGHPPAWPAQIDRDHAQPVVSDDGLLVAVPNGHRSFDQRQPAGMLIYGSDGRLRHSLPMPDDAVLWDKVFLRDDRLLVSSRSGPPRQRGWRCELWNPVTGRLIHAFPRDVKAIGTPGGRWIAAGRPWDARRDLPAETRDAPTALAIHDVESGKREGLIEDGASLRDVAWRPDGNRLLAVIGNRVTEWDMTGGDFVVTFESDGDPGLHPYGRVAYAADGQRRFATVEELVDTEDVEHILRGWDTATDERLPIGRVCVGYNSGGLPVFLGSGERFISMDERFGVRDVLTGAIVQTVPEHPEPVSEAAFLDADHFLCGDLLTDAVTGRQRRWILPGHGHTPLRDGRTLFSHHGVEAFLTDVASGVTLPRPGPDGLFSATPLDVAADPRGQRVAIAGQGRDPADPARDLDRIIVLDAARLDEPLILRRRATALAWRPDGRTFLAASHAGIDELDGGTGEVVRSFAAPPGRVRFITWSPDGCTVLAGGVRGHVELAEPVTAEDAGWAVVIDAASGRTRGLEGHTGVVTTGAFSADGRRCVTGSLDKTVRLWSTAAGAAVHCFRGHRGAVRRVAYAPRGDRILSAAADGALLWDVAGVVDATVTPGPLADACEVVETIYAGRPPAAAAAASRVVPAGSADQPAVASGRIGWPVIHVTVDAERQGRRYESRPITAWLAVAPTAGTVPVAAIGPDRRAAPEPIGKLLARSRDGRRRLVEPWNDRAFLVTDDRDRVLARVVHPHPFDVAGISPSGDDFAVVVEVERSPGPRADGRHEVTIHDAGTGRVKRTFDVAAWTVNAVSFDPLGRTLLLHVDGDDVELRDGGTGRRLGVIHGEPAGAVTRAAYSTDGRFIVTHEYPSPLIHVRDPLTLATRRILDNHLAVRWCRCSPDGRRLLVGQDYANSVSLVTSWDLETGARGWSRCGPAGEAGTFSADGRLYLTHAVDHVWALWDVDRGTIQCVLVSPEATPVFGPEGTTLHQHAPDGPQLWPPTEVDGPGTSPAAGR